MISGFDAVLGAKAGGIEILLGSMNIEGLIQITFPMYFMNLY